MFLHLLLPYDCTDISVFSLHSAHAFKVTIFVAHLINFILIDIFGLQPFVP